MTATTSATRAAPTAAQPAAARALLTGYFAVLGAVMAVWGARMPAVQAAAHLTAGALGAVLLAAAAGMVIGLQLGGRLAHHLPPALALTFPAAALPVALIGLGQCRTFLSLATAATCFGLAHGVLDVGLNTAAVRCQNAYRRPIMSTLHASYSLGALAGAATAAATAALPHHLLFTAFGTASALAALAAARATSRLSSAFQANTAPSTKTADHRAAPRTTRWLMGLLAAACLLGEGAAADWSAIHLRSLNASAATASAAYALYSAAMAAGRLTGDRLTIRWGPTAPVRVGALLAAAGLTAGLLIPSAPAALAGWAALGIGLSTTVPALITAAGRHGPRTVAAVTTTGYLGLLLGPAVIGALASATTLPLALALPAVLAAAIAATAHRALETAP